MKKVLEEMLDESHIPEEELAALEQKENETAGRLIRQVAAVLKPYWKID